ncbi:extracellular solute-binding protein [Anaerocolumna jejuensis]|uniref:extracellular solute-binding protein n=1 Tax=Anaerocolumna jejuensis TaxID=259063 RepID=UPI003F7BA9D0
MKRFVKIILCGLLVVSLAGCGKNSTVSSEKEPDAADITTEADKTDQGDKTAQEDKAANGEKEPVEIKIWHDGDEAIINSIQTSLNESLKDSKITVTFEKKAGLTDQIKLYGNDAASGPDMYFYANDSVGMFAEMGILAPVTDLIGEEAMADLLPMTVEAGTYKDKKYQLPVYFETLLFLYNKDLWKGEVPNTTEELYQYMKKNTDTAAGTYALVNQHSTAYNVSPFINGFGGYILNSDGTPGLNNAFTKDAIAYNKKFADLEADGDYNTVNTLFNDGKAAAIIGGPWLISGIKEAGINLGYKSLSDFVLPHGSRLAPYAGVQGVCVMKYAAEAKKEAISEVLKVLAGKETGSMLAKKSSCAPANTKSYDDPEVAANEMIVAMKETADTAQPMPNVPELSVMWAPTESLLAAVNKSGEDLNKAAEKYQKEALTAIADMQ